MTTTQIGVIEAKYITFFAMIVAVITILVCYGLSIHQGVVVPWLPMISDCFVYPVFILNFVLLYGNTKYCF